MNYIKIEKFSTNNGPGVRVVLWVSGCRMSCYNCQNPETWDFTVGKPFDNVAMTELVNALSPQYIQGITFSGGHPLEPENRGIVKEIILRIKKEMPEKDIWLYTGYRLPEDVSSALWEDVYGCDVVVDGPYIEELKDITLLFRGSKNQRLIDVKESMKNRKIVLLDAEDKY